MDSLNNVTNNLIKIVRNVFLGEKEELVDLDIQKICNLARFHSIEYIVYTGLTNYGIDLNNNDFVHLSEINAYKTIAQDLELEEIAKHFKENEICFLPMKGSVIKDLYPKHEYRNMADLDILVKRCDMKKAGVVLKKLGYDVVDTGGYHDIYNKEPYMHIEIHRSLISETIKNFDYYDNIWSSDRIYVLDDKYHYYLRDEDFYIFMIFHASKHFEDGGTGFRTFIDEYIYLKTKTNLNFDNINQELKKINLTKFHNILKDSVDYIFNHQEKDNINDVLEFISYIIDSGSYGNTLNAAASGVIMNGTKKKFILRRLFPTKEIMKAMYPTLKKAPYLLPFFYIKRLFKPIFHFRRYKKDYDQVKKLDEDEVKRVKKIKDIAGVE